MYKIVSFRYESVIQKNFERLRRAYFFFAPPNHKSVPTALIYILKHIRLLILVISIRYFEPVGIPECAKKAAIPS